MISETGEPFEDYTHILYVNAKIKTETELGKLMHDFSCIDPNDINYENVPSLRLEARQKLSKIRPVNLGQAGRISGVSPADLTALMIYLETGGDK